VGRRRLNETSLGDVTSRRRAPVPERVEPAHRVAPRPASTSGSPAGSRLLRLHRPKPHATQARRSSHHRVSLLPRACVGPACAVRRWHAVRAPLWPGPPCVPSLASRLSVRAPTRCSPPIKGRPRGRTREYRAPPRRHCCPSSSSLLH
jgi:hypothetical protein